MRSGWNFFDVPTRFLFSHKVQMISNRKDRSAANMMKMYL